MADVLKPRVKGTLSLKSKNKDLDIYESKLVKAPTSAAQKLKEKQDRKVRLARLLSKSTGGKAEDIYKTLKSLNDEEVQELLLDERFDIYSEVAVVGANPAMQAKLSQASKNARERARGKLESEQEFINRQTGVLTSHQYEETANLLTPETVLAGKIQAAGLGKELSELMAKKARYGNSPQDVMEGAFTTEELRLLQEVDRGNFNMKMLASPTSGNSMTHLDFKGGDGAIAQDDGDKVNEFTEVNAAYDLKDRGTPASMLLSMFKAATNAEGGGSYDVLPTVDVVSNIEDEYKVKVSQDNVPEYANLVSPKLVGTTAASQQSAAIGLKGTSHDIDDLYSVLANQYLDQGKLAGSNDYERDVIQRALSGVLQRTVPSRLKGIRAQNAAIIQRNSRLELTEDNKDLYENAVASYLAFPAPSEILEAINSTELRNQVAEYLKPDRGTSGVTVEGVVPDVMSSLLGEGTIKLAYSKFDKADESTQLLIQQRAGLSHIAGLMSKMHSNMEFANSKRGFDEQDAAYERDEAARKVDTSFVPQSDLTPGVVDTQYMTPEDDLRELTHPKRLVLTGERKFRGPILAEDEEAPDEDEEEIEIYEADTSTDDSKEMLGQDESEKLADLMNPGLLVDNSNTGGSVSVDTAATEGSGIGSVNTGASSSDNLGRSMSHTTASEESRIGDVSTKVEQVAPEAVKVFEAPKQDAEKVEEVRERPPATRPAQSAGIIPLQAQPVEEAEKIKATHKVVEGKAVPEAKPAKESVATTEPVKTEPVKTEPVKTEPVKAEPTKTEPTKTEPTKTEPVKAEPVKTEPVKAEPVKTEPVKAEAKLAPAIPTKEVDKPASPSKGRFREPAKPAPEKVRTAPVTTPAVVNNEPAPKAPKSAPAKTIPAKPVNNMAARENRLAAALQVYKEENPDVSISTAPQGSKEWLQGRHFEATASDAKRSTGGKGAQETYVRNKAEIATGIKKQGFTSAAMQRGNDLEPLVRRQYESHTGFDIMEVGQMTNKDFPGAASLDGIATQNGRPLRRGVEIKAPNKFTPADTPKSKKFTNTYNDQVQMQMQIANLDQMDLVEGVVDEHNTLQTQTTTINRSDEWASKNRAKIERVQKSLAENKNLTAEQVQAQVDKGEPFLKGEDPDLPKVGGYKQTNNPVAPNKDDLATAVTDGNLKAAEVIANDTSGKFKPKQTAAKAEETPPKASPAAAPAATPSGVPDGPAQPTKAQGGGGGGSGPDDTRGAGKRSGPRAALKAGLAKVPGFNALAAGWEAAGMIEEATASTHALSRDYFGYALDYGIDPGKMLGQTLAQESTGMSTRAAIRNSQTLADLGAQRQLGDFAESTAQITGTLGVIDYEMQEKYKGDAVGFMQAIKERGEEAGYDAPTVSRMMRIGGMQESGGIANMSTKGADFLHETGTGFDSIGMETGGNVMAGTGAAASITNRNNMLQQVLHQGVQGGNYLYNQMAAPQEGFEAATPSSQALPGVEGMDSAAPVDGTDWGLGSAAPSDLGSYKAEPPSQTFKAEEPTAGAGGEASAVQVSVTLQTTGVSVVVNSGDTTSEVSQQYNSSTVA